MRTARKREDELAIASFEKTRKNAGAQKGGKRTTHYGNVLRRYREEAGLDQGSVGKAIGYSTNTISNWENGVSRPDIDVIPKLCETLKIPLTVFFGLACDPASPEAEQRLLADFRLLSPRRRKVVSELIGQLAEDEKQLAAALRKGESFRPLPCQPLSAAAGVGIPMEESGTEPEMILVRDTPLSRRADEVFTVNGRSMEPDFPDGSYVYVRHADHVRPGQTGIFRVAGALMIKEYHPKGLRSKNPAYPMIRPTDDDQVSCVGLVLGHVPQDDIGQSLPSRAER